MNKKDNIHLTVISFMVYEMILDKVKTFWFLFKSAKVKLLFDDWERVNRLYEAFKKDHGILKFTMLELTTFLYEHNLGDTYSMVNRDGTSVICKVAYYPLPFKDLRALVEIEIPKGKAKGNKKATGTDFRECPIHYLVKINKSKNEKEK